MFLFLSISCLLCLCSISAFALGIDYHDYITDITVSGHNDLVEIRIPAEEQYFILINETQGWSSRFDSGYLDLVADGTDGDYDKYTINLHCFPGGRLNLEDIPDGTKFTAGFFYSYSGPGYETPYVSVHEQYYNSSGGYLGQLQETIGFSPVLHAGSVTHSGTFNKTGPYTNGVTGSADSIDLFLRMNDYSPLTNDFVMLQAEDFVLTMTISSLYELQQSQDKTNKILEAVEDKLEENGQKLDEIINGEVTPEPPVDSGLVDDANNAEQGVLDDTAAGLDDVDDVQQSATEILYQYWTAFASFSWVFSLFADLPFIYGLLIVSLSFGVIGSLLNLFGSIPTSQSDAKSGKTKSGNSHKSKSSSKGD